MDDPAREREPPPRDAARPMLRQVAPAELARTLEPAYATGAGWLLWRSGPLFGAHFGGPRWPELLPYAGDAIGQLVRGIDGSTIDLLVDAGGVRLEGGAHLLEPVAHTLSSIVRGLGGALGRMAVVAPSDWSTPWWHGLPLTVATNATWLTFSCWRQAFAWLDGAASMCAEVGRLLERRPTSLLLELERTLRQRPSTELSEVARLMGVSRRTLQRSLAREGIGFHAVRTGVRIERAQTLLSLAHVKISAVAREVGFASTGHFILWFRRHHGVTPGAWRLSPSRRIPNGGGPP